MIYLDTNILVYEHLNNLDSKRLISSKLVDELINSNTLLSSPLVIQELIFVLNKMRFHKNEISNTVQFLIKFSSHPINLGTGNRKQNLGTGNRNHRKQDAWSG
ncbi:MAG: PIN domain-containing protein [bacterium]|nr:PIN domain-containing protein [bacterium]